MLRRGLLIKVIWSLWIKGLQICSASNFINGLTPGGLESSPIALADTKAVMAESSDFFVRPPTLTADNFTALSPVMKGL